MKHVYLLAGKTMRPNTIGIDEIEDPAIFFYQYKSKSSFVLLGVIAGTGFTYHIYVYSYDYHPDMKRDARKIAINFHNGNYQTFSTKEG